MSAFCYKKWNTILGWVSFGIALLTYSLTVEPTISYWDCPEYIATSAKLEVGHPPGAPLFQLLGAFFSTFTTDVTHIALMVNMVSAVSSAFTILFMFWSLTMIMRRVVGLFKEEVTDTDNKVILGASFVASMAYTFSDTFWFNAVEAEVYAMSSLFIAILFWLGLRWERDMDKPDGNKWLLAISMFVGLSFGVHFMALLTIPSLGLLYYFKKYKQITIKNFILANLAVVGVLFFVFGFLLPYTMSLFAKTEIFMVNSLGLPFNSGTIFVALLIIGLFVWVLNFTKKKQYVMANTFTLCILFVFIGFSSWLMLPIRSNANTPINENAPTDATELLAYYNREQYGENKVFYGELYSMVYAGLDADEPYVDVKPNYERDYKTGKYVIVNDYQEAKQNIDRQHKAFLPRMRSTSDEHIKNYMRYTNPLEFRINPAYDFAREMQMYDLGVDIEKLDDEGISMIRSEFRKQATEAINIFKKDFLEGKIDIEDYHNFLLQYKNMLIIEKPSFVDNLKFMFDFQFGYMFGRYLMWNFSGRQNDIQGDGGVEYGNWITGISFVDDKLLGLGNQSELTTDMKNNKGRNIYFMIPFLLAVFGMYFHAQKDWKSFYVLLVMFLFMGLALKVFLNEKPFEPRERDYAVVGAFYVFAMWIAFGVYGLYDLFSKKIKHKAMPYTVVGLSLLVVPVLMASQNWDDHDRSGKDSALVTAKAYMDSLDENAIIFTIGDNDTFPLWYLQEVEGYRTDVKIVCTSLLVTDWYIDQMKQKTHLSEGLPISFEHHQYSGDKRQLMIYKPLTNERLSIKQFVEFIQSDDPRTFEQINKTQKYHTYPTNKIRFDVDKGNVLKNNIVSKENAQYIEPYIDININSSTLNIMQVVMLDILSNNKWERPVYFSGGAYDDATYLWMKDYLEFDGIVYKLVPIKTKSKGIDLGFVDTDKMYYKVMEKTYENGQRKGWFWGNVGKSNIYHDVQTRRNGFNFNLQFARLVEKLIEEKKYEKAENIVNLVMDKFPVEIYQNYALAEPFIGYYFELKQKDKALALAKLLIQKHSEQLNYYTHLSERQLETVISDAYRSVQLYRNVLLAVREYDNDFYASNHQLFNKAKIGLSKHIKIPDLTLEVESDFSDLEALLKDDSIEVDTQNTGSLDVSDSL